jgi:hypothetical protein
MYYVAIASDTHMWFWTGKSWIVAGVPVAAAPARTKLWKTDRGAREFIQKMREEGLLSPSQKIQVFRL